MNKTAIKAITDEMFSYFHTKKSAAELANILTDFIVDYSALNLAVAINPTSTEQTVPPHPKCEEQLYYVYELANTFRRLYKQHDPTTFFDKYITDDTCPVHLANQLQTANAYHARLALLAESDALSCVCRTNSTAEQMECISDICTILLTGLTVN